MAADVSCQSLTSDSLHTEPSHDQASIRTHDALLKLRGS